MTQEDYFSKGMLPPEMGIEVADGVMQNLNPQLRPEVDGLTSDISGQLADITDEELAQVIQLVQQLYDEPDNYAQNRAALIQSGELTEEDLPPQYDPEALAMMLYALRKEQQARSGGMSMQPPSSMPPMAGAAPPEMQPPQGFARGGIAEAARLVAGSGRFGDTMLAHINPREAQLLRKHGGSGTINPKTGLPEFIFRFLRKAWQAVWKPVAKFLNTKIGKIVSNIALNILIPGYGSIIASGLQTAAAGGNFGDIVKNMAISGATQYLSGGLADQGMPSPIQGQLDKLAGALDITSKVGKEALAQGVVNTGMGLVQGQSLQEAATSGIMAAGTVQASNAISNFYKDFKGAQAGAPDKPPVVEYDIETGRPKGASNMPERFTADGTKVSTSPYPYGTDQINPAALEGIDVPYQGKLAGIDYPYSGTSTTSNQPQVNAGTSTNMQTGASGTSSTAGSYKPVGIGDAFSTMGEGTKQMFTGDVSGGFNKLTQGAGDLFFPSSPSVTNILDSDDYKTAVSRGMDPKMAYTEAAKKLEPSFLRTYGPGAAAGLGIMAMAGGFDSPDQGGNPNGPQFRGPTGEDLLKQNPNKYLVQGLPGVQYDAQGNIIGNKEQYPYYRMPDIQVASNYGGAPRFADGGIVRLAQGGTPNKNGTRKYGPYVFDPNSPEMVEYRNMAQSLTPAARQYMASRNNNGAIADMNMMRQAMAYSDQQAARQAPAQENALYAANPEKYRPNMTAPAGGIAGLAAGGYPRKTGQISGPGTETSDSIPAMLSDGEFVMTARAVRGLGKGSRREGAKKMYALMHQLERNAARG